MRRRERKHAKMGMSKPGCMSFKDRMVTSKTLREEVGSVVQSRAISERTDRWVGQYPVENWKRMSFSEKNPSGTAIEIPSTPPLYSRVESSSTP